MASYHSEFDTKIIDNVETITKKIDPQKFENIFLTNPDLSEINVSETKKKDNHKYFKLTINKKKICFVTEKIEFKTKIAFPYSGRYFINYLSRARNFRIPLDIDMFNLFKKIDEQFGSDEFKKNVLHLPDKLLDSYEYISPIRQYVQNSGYFYLKTTLQIDPRIDGVILDPLSTCFFESEELKDKLKTKIYIKQNDIFTPLHI